MAGKYLADAFIDYPIHTTIFPDLERREKLLPNFMEFSIRSGMKFGNAYASSEKLEAIAVWLDPDHVIPGIFDILRLRGLSMLLQIRLRDLLRAKKIWDRVENLHKEHAPERHWYLESLAVQKKHRGKGLSRKLVAAKFQELDKLNLPAYLETHSDLNVIIYKKMGFEVIYQTKIPETDVMHYSMIREPNS